MRISDWSSDVCSSDLALERKESPAHFAHHIVGEFAFVFEVASLAGGRGLAAFFVGVRQARVPVPFVAERLIHGAMLGQHIVFVLVMVDTVVAGNSEERLVGKGWVSTCSSGWVR